MPELGRCAIPEVNGIQLGVCFVMINKGNDGVITSKMYWNHALEAWEVPPRIDSRHVLAHQRLIADSNDAEFKAQLGFMSSKAFAYPNVLAIVFTVADGKATDIYRMMTHNESVICSGIGF